MLEEEKVEKKNLKNRIKNEEKMSENVKCSSWCIVVTKHTHFAFDAPETFATSAATTTIKNATQHTT